MIPFALPFALPAIASTIIEFAKSKNGMLIIGTTILGLWLYWGHIKAVNRAEIRGEKNIIERSEKAGAKANVEAEKIRMDSRRGDPFASLCKRGDCRDSK